MTTSAVKAASNHVLAGDGPDSFLIRIRSEDGYGIEVNVFDNGTDHELADGNIEVHK